MAIKFVKFVTVTYTVKGTPIIERYSTQALAEARMQEIQKTQRVQVKVM
jgi:hypothetical protein